MPARDATGVRIGSLRQRSQWIQSSEGAPADAVHHLLAIQAQDLPSALWAIGLRSPGSSISEVRDAFTSGRIVRSWPMRGTLHVVPAVELDWMLRLSRDRMFALAARRRTELGLTDPQLGRARDAAIDLLAGGATATRAQLLAAFEQNGVLTTGQRGYHLIVHLAQLGVIVLGPTDDDGQLFVLLEDWVPQPRTLDGDDALGEIARRYVGGHGPVTERDFARWASLTLTQARRGLDIVRDEFETLQWDGTTLFMAPGAEQTRSNLSLLPAFDEFLIGYANRAAVISAEQEALVVPGKNGLYRPIVVEGGQVVGTWRARRSGRNLDVDVSPFGTLRPTVESRISRETDRYRAFIAG